MRSGSVFRITVFRTITLLSSEGVVPFEAVESLEELLELELDVLVLDMFELDVLVSVGISGSLEFASIGTWSMSSYKLKKYLITHFPALSLTLSLKWSFLWISYSRQSPSLYPQILSCIHRF